MIQPRPPISKLQKNQHSKHSPLFASSNHNVNAWGKQKKILPLTKRKKILQTGNTVMTPKKTSNQEERMKRPNVAPILMCSKPHFIGFRRDHLPIHRTEQRRCLSVGRWWIFEGDDRHGGFC